MIAKGHQWFAKLHNYVHLMVFPKANNSDGSFFGNVQYIHTDSIIASLGYPFKTILDRDIQWIVNFEPRQFAKLVFTNLTLSECALIVKTSQESNSRFAIDELFNEEVFVIETNKNLLFLSTISKSILSPTIKFRAIVTAEETPACFELDLLEHSKRHFKRRKELCKEPVMFLTSLSYLNLNQNFEEMFTIKAGEHQSIELTFIDFNTPCYYDHDAEKAIFRTGFAIKDADGEHEFCSTFPPPETYKSKSSEIYIHFRVLHGVRLDAGAVKGQDEGFRIQYRISDHSLQRYTDDEEEYGSSGVYACSGHFRKCYTVLSKEVSWDIANTECIKRNEHLVTVTSRNEMNYVQYLLRSRLLVYQQNRTEENEAADKQKFLRAHIGLKRVKDKQRRTDFIWITNFNVTFSAWKYGQPSTGDCTLTSFENFNDRELWETQNCFNNIADFYICEKPFSPDRENPKHKFKEDVCNGVYMKKDLIASPHSGKSCQNWRMLSAKAKSDFNTKFYSSRYHLHDSNMCKDTYAQDIIWCYVIDAGEYRREPCFLHRKFTCNWK
ncbi:uncharacterized protein LOC132755562 isoform X2 [Ruditapes philippinarum]|uniref:uncharacterized protein LOC132755562 isoform X2 n=1 Tax=Ruditapes philippinarum TaxID=129788 RepID=UPI00295A61F1|nr:uncharacterized protein LOC132755562 isoform X2 [Ruditapes philippinarum]